jgi:hypothetical protein
MFAGGGDPAAWYYRAEIKGDEGDLDPEFTCALDYGTLSLEFWAWFPVSDLPQVIELVESANIVKPRLGGRRAANVAGRPMNEPDLSARGTGGCVEPDQRLQAVLARCGWGLTGVESIYDGVEVSFNDGEGAESFLSTVAHVASGRNSLYNRMRSHPDVTDEARTWMYNLDLMKLESEESEAAEDQGFEFEISIWFPASDLPLITARVEEYAAFLAEQQREPALVAAS